MRSPSGQLTNESAALDLLASLVLEDGRTWGSVATPDQWADARAILGNEDPRPYHYLTRARGYSKSTDLAGMLLAAMLMQLPPGSRTYAVAADMDQGALIIDSIRGFTERTPGLGSVLEIGAYKATDRRTGCTLKILAADASGTWGLRPSLMVIDELAQWESTAHPRRLYEAVTSAMTKVPNSKMVILTSAGEPGHWSYKRLEHARSHRLWRTNEVLGPPPWIDPDRLDEQRAGLTESAYQRLFENRWTAAEDSLANLDDLRACVTLEGPLPYQSGYNYVMGVDIGITNDRTVVAVCHRESVTGYRERSETDPWSQPKTDRKYKFVLDRMEVWQGSRLNPVRLEVVEQWIEEAARHYRAKAIFDPFQAIGMMQRLQGKGVRCEEFAFSSASVGKLASTLHQVIRNQALALPDDEALMDELANVKLRETSPGVLRMDHDAGRHDDRAIALALAVHHLLEKGAGVMPTFGRMGDRRRSACGR